MESRMEEMQVGQWTSRKEVKLFARADIKQQQRGSDHGDFSAFHAYMNPSSRRPGSKEFGILADSLQDGSLWRACDELAGKLEAQCNISYTAVSDAMREHGVT